MVKVFKCCFTFRLPRRPGEPGPESGVIKPVLLRISDAIVNFRIDPPPAGWSSQLTSISTSGWRRWRTWRAGMSASSTFWVGFVFLVVICAVVH